MIGLDEFFKRTATVTRFDFREKASISHKNDKYNIEIVIVFFRTDTELPFCLKL